MNGKGSRRRPKKVDYNTYASNWDVIFGKREGLRYENGKWILRVNKTDISLHDKDYE